LGQLNFGKQSYLFLHLCRGGGVGWGGEG